MSRLGDVLVEHGPLAQDYLIGPGYACNLRWLLAADLNALRDELLELRAVKAGADDIEPACGYLLSHPSHDFALPDEDRDGEFGPRQWCEGVRGDWQQPMGAAPNRDQAGRGSDPAGTPVRRPDLLRRARPASEPATGRTGPQPRLGHLSEADRGRWRPMIRRIDPDEAVTLNGFPVTGRQLAEARQELSHRGVHNPRWAELSQYDQDMAALSVGSWLRVLAGLVAVPDPNHACAAHDDAHLGQPCPDRPWCGAPRDLGGQQPCPIVEPCDARTCRLGAASSSETYGPTPPAPCQAETRSWDHFTPEQVDSYWIRCTLQGQHDEHKDEHTGLTWNDQVSPATVTHQGTRHDRGNS